MTCYWSSQPVFRGQWFLVGFLCLRCTWKPWFQIKLWKHHLFVISNISETCLDVSHNVLFMNLFLFTSFKLKQSMLLRRGSCAGQLFLFYLFYCKQIKVMHLELQHFENLLNLSHPSCNVIPMGVNCVWFHSLFIWM